MTIKKEFVVSIIFLFSLISISLASDTSGIKVYWTGKSLAPITNLSLDSQLTGSYSDSLSIVKSAPVPLISVSSPSTPALHTKYIVWRDTAIFPIISIGPGIQTLTFSLGNGAIGVFDVLTPINIILNLCQRQLIQNQLSPVNFCFWAPSLGFLITKPSSSSEVTFGLSIIPYQIKINGFSFGIGVAWINQGVAEFKKSNLFITLPLTYSVDIGS